jgi:hypothetical protein
MKIRIENIECRFSQNQYEFVRWYPNKYFGTKAQLIADGYQLHNIHDDNFILTKPERKLDFIFYRMHVDLGEKLYNGVKDLRLLWDHFQIEFYKYLISTVLRKSYIITIDFISSYRLLDNIFE